MSDSVNPVLVESWRGPILENLHRGAFVIVSCDGAIIDGAGDIERMILPRSSYKMLQALPLIESGAASRFKLGAEELALACASHTGSQTHVSRISRWLEELGVSDKQLQCGPQTPEDKPTREALREAGQAPSALHHNCSGKHAGFLSVAATLDADLDGYLAVEGPVQQAVRAAISDLAGVEPEMSHAIDGCCAPNFALPLMALARAMARMAAPEASGANLSPTRRAAADALREAMASNPYLISGDGRACAAFNISRGAAAVCKTGADGVFTAMIPSTGLGVALKIDDGDRRAAECAMAAILVRLRLAQPEDERITPWINRVMRNSKEQPVGLMRPSEILS